jgi:hypothetical protein
VGEADSNLPVRSTPATHGPVQLHTSSFAGGTAPSVAAPGNTGGGAPAQAPIDLPRSVIPSFGSLLGGAKQFHFLTFAAFLILFGLMAPGMGRWLRPVSPLARPQAFLALRERPG